MQNRDYKLGYAKGYSAGTSRRWPEHKPIVPPDEIVGDLVQALMNMRNAVDGQLALFDPEDPLQGILGPHIDAADGILAKLDRWIKAPTLMEEGAVCRCGECGGELQIVRPGKYRCVKCNP